MLTLITALGLCAICTFLLRYLPIYLEKHHQGGSLPSWCQAGLQALGPAAMSALVVISFLPLLSLEGLSLEGISLEHLSFSDMPTSSFLENILPVLLACLAIWTIDRISQNVILACFSGVFLYGLSLYLFSG